MKNKKLLLGVGLFLAVAVVIGLKFFGRDSSANTRRSASPIVTVEQPRRENVQYELKFTADVLPIQQANIYSKVAGNIDRIYVDIGTEVTTGQMMALIDTLELSQQAQQASATYQNAKLTFERTKELSEQNLVAKQDLDNADAAMKVAKANFDVAKTHLDYAHITAPFSGYVTKRLLDPGVAVKANDASLFTLMSLEEMKIMVDVLEKDIPLVKVGTPAVITVDAFPNKEFHGSVSRVSQAVDLSTRTMAMQINVSNRDHLLKPGMFASVKLVVDEHPNAITVPTSSLVKDARGTFLYIVNNSIAHRITPQLGIEQDGRTEVLTGLAGNEKIITAGQQFLKDSAAVNVQQ